MKLSCSWISQIFCCSRQPVQATNDVPNHGEEAEETEPLEPKVLTDQPTLTSQPKLGQKESQVILCCSSSAREDQIDLCPSLWYREFIQDEQGTGTCHQCRRLLWRLCFITTCLPLCYPCYLTRSIRRRRKHMTHYLNSEPLKDKFNNQLNETIQRQLTKKSNTSTKATTLNLNVINVNVIIMHSPASNILHQYLRTSNGDGCHGAGVALPVRLCFINIHFPLAFSDI